MIDRRLMTGALALVSLLGSAEAARAATLYVTPTGSDAGTCTLAAPCRQVTRALQLVGAGDTVNVANGSYNGFDVVDVTATAGAPIVIVAPGKLADITPNAGRNSSIYVEASSYVTIDGFRCFNAPESGIRVTQSDHITIRNGVFGNNQTWGIRVGRTPDVVIEDNEAYGSVEEHGIYVANSADRPIIRRNRIHDNNVNGIHMNGDFSVQPGDGIISFALVEGNIIYNNGFSGGAGINTDGLQDSTIRNNLIYNNHGTGMRMYAEDGAEGPKNNKVYHNTVDLASDGGTGLSVRQSAGPNEIRNNILLSRNPNSISLKYGDANDIALNVATSDNNVIEDVEAPEEEAEYSLAEWQALGHEPNSLNASVGSLWVNPGAGDYHLSATSPAIDQGLTLTAVPTDIEGVARPQGAASDIGAYERASGPSLTINNVTVTEGNTGTVNANFTVTLSQASAGTVTVSWATANGTASQPSDYTSGSGILTFGPGETTKTVTVAVNGDPTVEANETFFVNLSGASGATISDNQGQGTITNDDLPALSINDVALAEGNAGTVNASFTVTLTPTVTGTVTVNFATANGTATAPSDYAATSGTLTFSPGTSTRTVTVVVNGDTNSEGNETFFVNLSGASGATISDNQGQGTITNDDLPALSINDVAVTEGNAGTVNASFTVTLSSASSSTVTVNWATANGTATAGSDYVAGSGSLTFTPGQTTRSLTTTVNGDTTVEPNESFLVNLSGASGASVSDSQGQATINNDDLPSLTINDVTVTEGNSGTVNANFTVTLSPTVSGTVAVNWSTANGTATAPSDYASASGSLSFAPGQATRTVTVVVNGDTAVEPNETFLVNLSGASGATISDGQGQGTITNDDAAGGPLTCPTSTVSPNGSYTTTVSAGSSVKDWVAQYTPGSPNSPWIGQWKYVPLPRPATVTMTAPGTAGTYELRLFANDGFVVIGSCTFQVALSPTLSINDVTVTEGNAGSVNANFTVTLSPTSSGTVTVGWATANGTATAPSDFASGSGSLTFGPAEGTKTVTVVVNGDTASETNETFFVNLSGASGATITDGQGQATITNDDGTPALTCPTSPVAPNGSYTTTVNIGSSAKDWVAQYTPGSPNNPWIGVFKYVPLPRPQTVTMTAPASPGTYELRLFANDGFVVIGSCTFSVGAAGPAMSINDVTVVEGNAGTVNASFTVTLSPTSSGAVTVSWATANGTATASSDYVSGSGSLTFNPGESTKTATVAVNGDTATEPNETFYVNLSGASGATVTDGQGQATITNDDGSSALTCPTSPVAANGSYTTTVSVGGSAKDWVAQYTPGSPNSPWIGQWKYVPLPRPTTVTMTAPGTAGTYELRLLANDGFVAIGSCTFQVQ